MTTSTATATISRNRSERRVLRTVAVRQHGGFCMLLVDGDGHGISADYVYWLTDLNMFLYEGKFKPVLPRHMTHLAAAPLDEPPHYGDPVSYDYTKHWHRKTEEQRDGKTTLLSGIEMTPLSERVGIWKRFQPDEREPGAGFLAGRLPFPSTRNLAVCLADPSGHAKVEEAPGKVASQIGPEFVLF
ncbi:hypothetical protein DL762_005882 [Monosporascus cannonballus]|uniref:Uncharacterized protein n=1 Tax=Monosporascus cannonballus TaxID=155416 RepID=A0ABY0H3L0_9PEZI|nr:hypothetical protein DL763_010562 [Monosporascus cannonballus]RYO83980.1 hypothetical protein DL762_005882 [Monosporascus cannonballus]